ncbi:MAG: hypothetical protein AAF582_00065 [Pseudomonadota bacterium]
MAEVAQIPRNTALTPAELVLVSALSAHVLSVFSDQDWDKFQMDALSRALEEIEPRDETMKRLCWAASLILRSEYGSGERSRAGHEVRIALREFYETRLLIAWDKFQKQNGED